VLGELGTAGAQMGAYTPCDPGGTKPAACGSNVCNRSWPYFGRVIDIVYPMLRVSTSWLPYYRP